MWFSQQPQIWLRPPVLTPMTGKQLIKEGLVAGPRKCQPLGFKILAVGPWNASALALGVIVTAGPAPFSLPASEGVVQASLAQLLPSGRSILRKVWCRAPEAAVTLV